MTPTQHLVAACLAMDGLTFIVALRMFRIRVGEMMARRIHPQAVALSGQRAERLQDSRASDNYNNLFEMPVLFYLLCAVAIGTGHVPAWLPALAWLFVLTRIAHSFIQCTYNKVMHRFAAFLGGVFLLMAMWAMYGVSFLALQAG